MDMFMDWYSMLSVQGVVSIASLAFSIYNFSKIKKCTCNKRTRDESFYSPVISELCNVNESVSIKSGSNMVRLPKRKKLIRTNENKSLLESIKSILEDSSSILSDELKRIISSSMEKDELTNEQCISAMSYEFVGIYGSEKIQQADVELLCTIFSKTINIEYKGYVEFLIVLKLIDEVVFKAFDPKTMLLSMFMVTSDPKDEIDEKALFKFIKRSDLEISKFLSSITSVSICKNLIQVKEEDVHGAIDTIKAAIVRRSSRIRKINK